MLIVIFIAFETYWRFAIQIEVLEFVLLSLFALIVYPRLAMWLSLWLGTIIRNYTMAMIIAICIVAATAIAPIYLGINSISPLSFWSHVIDKRVFDNAQVFAHVTAYTGAWLLLSQTYLRRVDRLLGRQ